MVRKEGYGVLATQQQVTTHQVGVQEPAVFVMRGASGFLFVGDYWDLSKATFDGGFNPGRAPAYRVPEGRERGQRHHAEDQQTKVRMHRCVGKGGKQRGALRTGVRHLLTRR